MIYHRDEHGDAADDDNDDAGDDDDAGNGNVDDYDDDDDADADTDAVAGAGADKGLDAKPHADDENDVEDHGADYDDHYNEYESCQDLEGQDQSQDLHGPRRHCCQCMPWQHDETRVVLCFGGNPRTEQQRSTNHCEFQDVLDF